MKIFEPLYERAILWARHKNAPALLTFLSFIEAIFFPVPPELMLAPMCVAKPRSSFWYATLSLIGSLAGAVIGYLLGHFAFEAMQPVFDALGWTDAINKQIGELRTMVQQSPWRAFGALVIAGFSPIPLKVFTWASGIVGVPFVPFLAAMVVGRGKRVFLVAGAIRLGGEKAEATLRRHIEPVGWGASILLVGAVVWVAISHGS